MRIAKERSNLNLKSFLNIKTPITSTIILFFTLSLVLLPGLSFSNNPIPIKIRFLHAIDAKASGYPVASATAIAIDSDNGELFMLDSVNKRVVITDLEGIFNYEFSFTKAGLVDPKNFMVSPDGKLYFIDSGKVVITDYDGTFIKQMDLSVVPKADRVTIQSVAITSKYIYLGEALEDRVLVFDVNTLQFITEYSVPTMNVRVAADDKNIFILDPASFAVLILDNKGNQIGQFGRVSGLAGGFSMPVSIAIDSLNDRVVVVDINRAAVIYFDREGNFLYEFGGDNLLYKPTSSVIDNKGRVYVADRGRGGGVSVFSIYEEDI